MDAHVAIVVMAVNVAVNNRARHWTADGDDAMTTSSFASLLPPPRNITNMMVGTS